MLSRSLQAEQDVVFIGLLLELADGLEVIDGRVPWPEVGMLPWLVLNQCARHSLQEDVGNYLVDNGKKVNGGCSSGCRPYHFSCGGGQQLRSFKSSGRGLQIEIG